MTHDEQFAKMVAFVDKWYLTLTTEDLRQDCEEMFPGLTHDEIVNYIYVTAYGKFNACWSF